MNSPMINVNKGACEESINALRALNEDVTIQNKLNTLNQVLALSKGETASQLKLINAQLQTAHANMHNLITATTITLQTILTDFEKADQ